MVDTYWQRTTAEVVFIAKTAHHERVVVANCKATNGSIENVEINKEVRDHMWVFQISKTIDSD